MRVTYLGHSGFLVEWEDVACLFDYFEGGLPAIGPDRKLFIFSSHSHSDHFREEIFAYGEKHGNPVYVLSSDIPETPGEQGVGRVVRVTPGSRKMLPGGEKGVMNVFAMTSTDIGVAFVVNYGGKTLYHAGDLHWWAWPDNTPEEELDMKTRFFREIAVLKGVSLDAAFLPLDSRLEENYWLGFDAVMRTANIQNAFPMHMWEDYDAVNRFLHREDSQPYRDNIRAVTTPGQVFEI